ncbi:MAG TPA: hypothetical protein V6D35_19430 [Candidatus Sericytochromatia bacterium]|jgi:hypothetical protein
MIDSTEVRKQQYKRMLELAELAIQRRLDLEAKGDIRRRTGRKGDDYLTEEERQEFFELGRQLSGMRIIDGYIHCQGKAWKLPNNSPLLQEQIEAEF